MVEKTKEELEEKEIDSEEKLSKKEKKALDKANERIEILEKDVNTWKNKYYEVYADMDNLRKKMEKDMEVYKKYRGQGFLEALLPMFDNFYNCFKFKPDDPKLMAYCQGFEMIYNQMILAIESEGVKEFIPNIGDKFDHTTMQAVDVVEGEEDDVVVNVACKGYFLKDRLVRAASVVVSKKKVEETTENEDNTSNAN